MNNQIRSLTREQRAYLIRHYTAGWGLAPIAARLPGIGVVSLKFHLRAAGIELRASGGQHSCKIGEPPPFRVSDFRTSHKRAKPPPPPPDPRVRAWHKPIWPGWRVHGIVREP